MKIINAFIIWDLMSLKLFNTKCCNNPNVLCQHFVTSFSEDYLVETNTFLPEIFLGTKLYLFFSEENSTR